MKLSFYDLLPLVQFYGETAMPVDIKALTEGWLELESDPGLFTLLLEDFGVKVSGKRLFFISLHIDCFLYHLIFSCLEPQIKT